MIEMIKETRLITLAVVCGTLFVGAAPAAAAPLLRHKVDQKGDFVLFGNTVGFECANPTPVPRPIVGILGNCGTNTSESSPDIFWRADDPAPGQARADTTISAAQARSTAVLQLPAGAMVTYARLYWAAIRPGASEDTQVLLERVGAGPFSSTVTADASVSATATTATRRTYYQSTADVTELVRTHGQGAYRVSGIDTVELANLNEHRAFVAWSMVVFYQRDGEPQRNLALFDGLDLVEPGQPPVDITLSGFLVPNAGFDAKLGVVAYEGDGESEGDRLFFNNLTTPLADALNPANNFFNSTRSHLGNAVSNVGDLPQLTGTPLSMSGVDIDVVDVTDRLERGDTSASIRASTTSEFFITGVFVTSISTLRPDFSLTYKTYTNLSRTDGVVRPNDILQYTITTTNNGNDSGTNVVLTDVLPQGVTYVPGSLSITSGPNSGAKTDGKDNDHGEYDPNTRTITVRLGNGANGNQGGTLQVGASTEVVFRVRIDADASGVIANRAVITAAGQSGAPAAMFPSDGNGPEPGVPPTDTPIDACTSDEECTNPAAPVCLKLAHPWTCIECSSNANCTDPLRPVCQQTTGICRACASDAECGGDRPICHVSGRCAECSANNSTRCLGSSKPLCDVATGLCTGCASNASCSGTTPICDLIARSCRPCSNDAECPLATPACLPTGACGECSATNTSRCMSPRAVCDTTSATCAECLADAQCPMARPLCDPTTKTCRGCASDADCAPPASRCDTATSVCVGCRTHADCEGLLPLCSPQTQSCVPCTSDAACAAKDLRFPACQVTGPLLGACTECSATNLSLCTNPRPQCLTDLGFCGCSDQDGDGECGGPMSGIVCNAPVGICIPGCSTVAGRNGCPAAQTCSAAGNAIGSCVVGACMGDADCMAPRPKCDLAVAPGSCVQCLMDGDCPALYVCDSAATKTCVECTTAKTQRCSPNAAGARCLGNGTCGCLMDSECGGPTSGRVCDGGLSKCSPGCRGTGGNTCPAQFVCTSTDHQIGRCVPIAAPVDAGVDGPPDAGAPDVALDVAPDLAPDTAVDRGPDVVADVRADRALTPDRATADMGGGGPQEPEPSMPMPDPDPDLGIDGYLAGGGCQCDLGGGRTGSGPGGTGGLWLLAPFAALLAIRRRRRRR
jgi:uncharacterized repeat protein (TIGR01451 family)